MNLKTLRAKRCRGIIDGPDLPFAPGGLLLCGSNGTGKSSFIDALEYALTGSSASLDTGDRGLSWSSHGAHVNGGGPPEVELVFDLGGAEHTWSQSATGALPAPIKTFLDAARNETFILRRKAILDFIDAKPAERYKALESFFKLDEYTAFEAKLKALVVDCQQRLKAVQDEQRGQANALRLAGRLGPNAPLDDAACIDLLNASLAMTSLAQLDSLNNLSARTQESQTALQQFQNMDTVQKLKGVLELTQNLPNEDTAIAAGREYQRRLSDCLDEETKLKGQFLEHVLRDGLKWIELDSLDCCPLCEEPIDRKLLAEAVQKRLSAHQGLAKLRLERDQAASAFKRSLQTLASEWSKLGQLWKAALAEELPSEAAERLAALNKIATEPASVSLDQLEVAITSVSGLQLSRINSAMHEDAQRRTKAFPDYAQYEHLVQANTLLTAIATYLRHTARNSAEEAHLESSLNASKKISTHAENARKAAVQKLVESITNQADQYFRAIHPGESIGNPVLIVPRQGAASLQLKSAFYGRESDPRGYYSEGHVDSLGLCLFLALRRLHHTRRPGFALLVLDDVLHSVDGEHRRTTADLIFREFSDHQIVITTHDVLWFEQLKRAARQHAKNRRFAERRIGSWSLTEGPMWGDHLSDREWLESAKADAALPADRVIKAGRMLEQMLQHLCHNLAISVPFNIGGRYTLDPLWNSFASKSGDYKEFKTASTALMATLQAHIGARNAVGGHYNDWAQGFTPAEAKAFSDAALELHAKTYCHKCGDFIKRVADIDGLWSCRGQHLQYLKKPPATTKA